MERPLEIAAENQEIAFLCQTSLRTSLRMSNVHVKGVSVSRTTTSGFLWEYSKCLCFSAGFAIQCTIVHKQF